MRDECSRLRGDKRGDAGVAEKIEHLRFFKPGDFFFKPRPIRRLFWEDAGVLESGQSRGEARVMPRELPRFWHRLFQNPFTPFFMGRELGMHCLPEFLALFLPERLR